MAVETIRRTGKNKTTLTMRLLMRIAEDARLGAYLYVATPKGFAPVTDVVVSHHMVVLTMGEVVRHSSVI